MPRGILKRRASSRGWGNYLMSRPSPQKTTANHLAQAHLVMSDFRIMKLPN